MKPELKPCPFCGGKAEFKRTVIKTNGAWCDAVCVRCTVCDARTNRVLYDAKKHPNCEEYEEAAADWNRRVGDDVKVVRCKDCKWLYRNSEMCCCKKHTGLALIKPDGSSFCSYGEREE